MAPLTSSPTGKSEGRVPSSLPVVPPSVPSESLRPAAPWNTAGISYIVLVTVVFAKPLIDLARFAWGSELFSHILLVPFVSVYLWRLEAPWVGPRLGRWTWPALGCIALGAGLGAYAWWGMPTESAPNDRLAASTVAYLCLLLGGAWRWLGPAQLRQAIIPVGFLAFMIPWPEVVVDAVETGLQYASAEVSNVFLLLSGTPFVRDGLSFQLPGITVKVAQECSGVHSSYVLLMTSIVAGRLFLQSATRRWVLALVVIPLGILRNGFRILVIAMLCVHVSPDMIDSPIHHRGGPVFFVISLVPFFLLLVWLRKRDRKAMAGCNVASAGAGTPVTDATNS